jgi:hypothetical protein
VNIRRELLAPLNRLGRTLKRRAVVQGLCRTLALILAVVAVHFALDRLLLLGIGPRAVLLVIVISIAAYRFWSAVLRSALLPISPGDVAAVSNAIIPLERSPHFRRPVSTGR